MKTPRYGGGWKAIAYSMKVASRVGWWNMWKAMRSRNTCKTCAVGMGGQLGGMVNEGGHFPEVCKKSFQAMGSDLQSPIPDDFTQRVSIHSLRSMTPRQLEFSGRLAQPLLLERGSTHYQPISWDEAIQRSVEALKDAGPQRSFFYASGRSSNEAGFLLQMMSRLFGTNYVNNCSYYCHQASGVGLGSTIGTGAGTVRLEDLDKVDLYILIGANPSSNHPRLMRTLMNLRRRGGKVVVVNPVRELGLTRFRVPSDVRSLLFGSEIASDYLQPHIGGDMALLVGIAKEVIEQNAHDPDFIRQHTEGFDDYLASVRQTSWEQICNQSGIDRATISSIARQYIASKNTVIGWCMGITHHLHGTASVQAIAALLLLRGMLGRRNAGAMPIRGHSNVQGLGSVGVTPVMKQSMLQRYEQKLGITPPTSPGYDTMACMQAAHRGEMDFSLCLGGNLYGSNPDSQFAMQAMQKLKTIVYMSTTLNTGHAWGTADQTIILPVLPRDEEPQTTTQESMFSFVRLSDGGKARMPGPRSEVSILSQIGQQLLGPESKLDWKSLESHSAIRELIADLIPEYQQLKTLDSGGKEFHVPGRAVENYQFPTASGRATFHAFRLPETVRPSTTDQQSENTSLTLMTLRSEGQFNSVVYDEEDLYRGQERRDVILMNADDIQRMRLQANDRVRVTSAAGEMRYILVRPFDIRAGNAAMYYPEANVLVPHAVDPLSKTPAFKSVAISVERESNETSA
ncbi:MAG: FdhF/YdeP family oxidoreductase [Planctomycetaceae bacterium]|nr:FdhF/YdeP family oxidoreductase [Planctomycetaceae bacterium]